MRTKSKSNRIEINRIETKSIESNRIEINRIEPNRIEFRVRIKFESFTVIIKPYASENKFKYYEAEMK